MVRLPKNTKRYQGKISEIEWREISGLRNILIHRYFEVNTRIWDVIKNKVPNLKEEVS